MIGRYCEMCDVWWAHRITTPCPACGADTVKGEIPLDPGTIIQVPKQRKSPTGAAREQG